MKRAASGKKKSKQKLVNSFSKNLVKKRRRLGQRIQRSYQVAPKMYLLSFRRYKKFKFWRETQKLFLRKKTDSKE